MKRNNCSKTNYSSASSSVRNIISSKSWSAKIKAHDSTAKKGRRYIPWETKVFLLMLLISAITVSVLNRMTKSWNHNRQQSRPHHGQERRLEEVERNNPEAAKRIGQMILSGHLHLVDVKISPSLLMSSSDGKHVKDEEEFRGIFCHLDWNLQKEDPTRVPMFHDLVRESRACKPSRVNVNLREFLPKLRSYDNHLQQTQQNQDTRPRALPLGGFIFHETRCGSTLVSNALVAADPQGHRVHSEHQAVMRPISLCINLGYTGPSDIPDSNGKKPASATSSRCHIPRTIQMIRDIVYLTSRTDNPHEHHLYHKLDSVANMGISLIRRAFPHVPWMFLYRDSVEVLSSHASLKAGLENANCVGMKTRPTLQYDKVFERRRLARGEDFLHDEDHCAAYIATICDAVQQEQQHSSSSSSTTPVRFVNYNNLPDAIFFDIFPHLFHIPMTDIVKERIENVSGKYSKRRDDEHPWKREEDRQEKERVAGRVQRASEMFLKESYEWLEREAERTSRGVHVGTDAVDAPVMME